MARKFLGGKPVVGTGSDEVVVETLTITATDPVTIDNTTSADLSANRTIAVKTASTTQAGVTTLSTTTPGANSGAGSAGTEAKAAKGDHYHPTTGLALSATTLTGTAPITIDGASATAKDLSANRTIAVAAASTSASGVVQLSDSTSTTGSTKAATETAVKAAYDKADAAIAKSLITTIGDLIIGAGTPAVPTRLGIGANTYVLTSNGTTASWAAPSGGGGSTYVAEFSKAGTIATGTGTFRWYNDSGATRTIGTVRASVGTAPTGASLIVDVNVSASGAAPATIYSTQANRPSIAASAFTATGSTKSTTTIADGDYFTVDIDQVGSTIAGSDLTVLIWLT